MYTLFNALFLFTVLLGAAPNELGASAGAEVPREPEGQRDLHAQQEERQHRDRRREEAPSGHGDRQLREKRLDLLLC